MRFHTSVTERGTFRTCRRQWYYGTVLRLAPKDQVQWNLIFGDCIHAGLDAYYRNKRSLQHALDAFEMAWVEEDNVLLETYGSLYTYMETEWIEWREKGETMLTYYDIYDKQTTQHKILDIAIEERAFIPIFRGSGDGTEPLLSGRIDIVEEREDGIWIRDHKTAAQRPHVPSLDVDDQLTAYCYIYWRLTGIVPRGAEYNVLMKNPPKPPRVLKDGSLSKDKSQLTTYDLYLKEIAERDLDSAEYEDILEILKEKGWHQFFFRDESRRSLEELESFEYRLHQEYLDMNTALTDPQARYPNPSQWICPSCSQLSICRTLEEKGDVDYIIENGYVELPPRIEIPKGV